MQNFFIFEVKSVKYKKNYQISNLKTGFPAKI